MHRHRSVSTAALAALGCMIVSLPLILGQGCPGGNGVVIPVTGRPPGSDQGTNGDTAPTFRFTSPLGDVQAEIGDTIIVSWADSDPDSNATIAILLDPDDDPNNGNEIPIQTNISEDDTANSLAISTGSLSLITGSYRIVARVSDGVNPELVVTATGSLKLFEVGMMPSNVSPFLSVSQPKTNLSLSQGSEVTVNYCGSDRDGGEGNIVADVIIMLDNDNNPLNDIFSGLDATSADATVAIRDICTAAAKSPVAVNGGIVLGCTKDDKCSDPAVGTDFKFTIDTAKIPQRPGGEPYQVRVDMWDHTNPAVHAYAAGMLNITTLASGTVDLGRIGRQLAGTKFIGFDTGARAGFTGTSLGDYDGDKADDFIIVSRYGRPYERGNLGSAHMVYGTPGKRFGAEVYLNSYGIEYRGCQFASGHTTIPWPTYSFYSEFIDDVEYLYLGNLYNEVNSPVTDGITSVSYIESMNGDTKPEIMFGLPYVEDMWDWADDDPCDKAMCYNDGWPNPLSTIAPDNNDNIGRYDHMVGWYTIDNTRFLCSNENDQGTYRPLHQGYMIYVDSNNVLENTVIDLPIVGQHEPDGTIIPLEEGISVPGSSFPTGARLRGGYYTRMFNYFDYSLTGSANPTDFTSSYYLPAVFDRATQFAATIGSMPDMSNGLAIPMKDGASEYLISAPGGLDSKGVITLIWGHDLTGFVGQSVKSIPEALRFAECARVFNFPGFRTITGRYPGDQLGHAGRAGDFNRDGHQDILCGSPGSSLGTDSDVGAVYIIFGRLDFGNINLSKTIDPNDPTRLYVPRIEILGMNAGDRFGENQIMMGDVNSDGFADIAISSQYADGPGGVDSGFVGVVFGGRKLTGENTFSVSQIGTAQLPGAVFYGSQLAGHAGATIADAGDFNHDGYDDLLICAPGESLTVGQQTRHGVAYLVFGGPHLYNSFHVLNEVGTDTLPGIVFVSPYAEGTGDEATIDWVGAAGDVDGDGFDDVLIGLSEADFVNPLEPGQRRVDAGEVYLVYGNNTGTNTLR